MQHFNKLNSQISKKPNYLSDFLKNKQLKNKNPQENYLPSNTLTSGFSGHNRNSLHAALFDQNATKHFMKKGEGHQNFDFMRDHQAQNLQIEKKRNH